MSDLFIGFPIYNGARFLRKSIASIQAQSYRDWIMLISDNCSTDETPSIAKELARLDSRITYVRQEKNIGGEANFAYLLNRATTPFFMWASDDLWDKEFITSGIKRLVENPKIGFTFSNIVNIDENDNVIREYPSFSRLITDDRLEQVKRFASDNEKLGKANFLYSIFRTDIVKKSFKKCPFNEVLGAEMCFILATLALTPFSIDERVLFKKRILQNEGRGLGSPWQYPDTYIKQTMLAVTNTPYEEVVREIMTQRKANISREKRRNIIRRVAQFAKNPIRLISKKLKKK